MSDTTQPFSEEPHYAAIGRIASLWAIFELDLDLTNITLARVPLLAGVCLTAQIAGAGRKLEAFIALAELRIGKSPQWTRLIRDLKKLAMDARSLGEQRNRAVHDPWHVSETRSHRLEVTARKKLRFLQIASSTEELDRLAANIAALTNRFYAIRDSVIAAQSGS
jgi:hypothetical protein